MGKSELFLLFPVYKEAQEKPHYIKTVDIMSNEDLEIYISAIDDIIQFFKLENYDGYYDGKNVQEFLLPLEIAEDCYPNMKTRFRLIMGKWGEDWRKNMMQSNMEKYRYFCSEIKDDTLCELTKRKICSIDGSTFLLINHNAISCSDDMVRTKCNDKDFEIDVRNTEIKAIAKWFEANRIPQRIFHLNPKHGENGKGAHSLNKGYKVSILMCSQSEAGILLRKAIGEDLRTLFFFDTTHNQYIEFKRESDNIYHAFHLDKEDEKKIPNSVIEAIRMLNQ
jgi:hypothetical protein